MGGRGGRSSFDCGAGMIFSVVVEDKEESKGEWYCVLLQKNVLREEEEEEEEEEEVSI